MDAKTKPRDHPKSYSRLAERSALRIAIIYAVAGGLWILFSDQVAGIISGGRADLFQTISLYKGWGYIFVTAWLLYWMIRRDTAALREGEEKFSKIFYASPVPVTITRASDGHYVEVNDAFLERMGCWRPEVIGKTALELGAWADSNERGRMMEILYGEGSLRDFEAEFRTQSGEVGTALLFREVIELGGEKHFIGTTLDITERKRGEDALAHAYDATIEGWSRAMDLRDHETEGHTRRVTTTTLNLARHMGIDEPALVQIRRGALLHDIGKIGVPDRILLKPDSLTADEWQVMRLHPALAYEMLTPIEFLLPALDIPYCHHERWNGSGYPRGLRQEEIPLAARIFAVLDVYDALTSDRPYRPAWSREKAREYIRERGGQDFDPREIGRAHV